MTESSYDLQILLASGPEAPEKAVLAMATALSGTHSAVRVRLVMAMRGTIWCAPSEGNAALVEGYPPIGEMLKDLVEEGVGVFGCSSCIDQYCPAPVDSDGHKILRAGIARIGLSLVTLHMIDTPTVTF